MQMRMMFSGRFLRWRRQRDNLGRDLRGRRGAISPVGREDNRRGGTQGIAKRQAGKFKTDGHRFRFAFLASS